MTVAYTAGNDFQKVTALDHASPLTTFTITTPGTYGIIALAASWSAGSLDLQALGPDGSTYVSVLAAAFAANGYKTVDLIPGTYKFVPTTTDGISAVIARVKRGT